MNTKTQLEPQDRTPSAPVAIKQPETPEKASGPQRAAPMGSTASAAGSPGGGPTPVRGAEILMGQPGMSAGSRARTMMTLQQSVGNHRVSKLVGQAIQPPQEIDNASPPEAPTEPAPATAEPSNETTSPSAETRAASAETAAPPTETAAPSTEALGGPTETAASSEETADTAEANAQITERNEESIAVTQQDADAEAVEATAQAEIIAAEAEAMPVPSLVSLIEPAPEEAAEEEAASPTSTTSGSQETITPIFRMPDSDQSDRDNDAGEVATNTTTTTEAYDPIAALSSVQRFIGSLTSASADSHSRIQQEAESIKAALAENADVVRQSVHTQVVGVVASLRAAFAAERATIQLSISAARDQIDAALQASSAAAAAQGEEAKASFSDLFTQHRANVSSTVETSVSDVAAMRSRHIDAATQRTQQQAREARNRGIRKSAGYPATQRGYEQGEAVEGVANRTAQEMEERLPETIGAIAEILEDIPDEFRDQGEQALEGIDEGLPELLAHVDETVAAVTTALENQAIEAKGHLTTFEESIVAQLESAEVAAVAQAEALEPQANAQIDAGLEMAFSELDAATTQATDQIQQIVDQAIEILSAVETPDEEGARGLTDQILTFVSGATEETINSLGEAGTGMAQEFGRVDRAADDGLQTIEQEVAEQLPALTESMNSSLSDVTTKIDEGFGNTITGMTDAFGQTHTQILEQLTQSINQLSVDFGQTLTQADAEVVTARNEGLAKNDEALAELEPQMQEAADDAAWEYDHPVLSTLKSIGAIVLGVIAGILVVLAMVVVIIIAFKLFIAGLVALGVSLAVAKLIAAVFAIGLLAYGIYSAYQARIEAGEEGGWATFGGALLDFTGITDMRRAFTQPGLSPFQRGFAFGKGFATLASFFLGRRLNRRINARLPRSITNPVRGSALRWLRLRFGPRPPAARGPLLLPPPRVRGRPNPIPQQGPIQLGPGQRPPLQLPAPRQRGRPNQIPPRGPIPANPPIRITPDGMQHVVDRHTIPGLPQYAARSKFFVGEDLVRLITEGTQQPMVRQPNGNFARTFDAGRFIGIDRNTNLPTRIMTIITRPNGNLVTAFPGPP